MKIVLSIIAALSLSACCDEGTKVTKTTTDNSLAFGYNVPHVEYATLEEEIQAIGQHFEGRYRLLELEKVAAVLAAVIRTRTGDSEIVRVRKVDAGHGTTTTIKGSTAISNRENR